MTIYDELKKDHRKVITLLDQLIAAEESNPTERDRLVNRVRDELIPHSRAEEAVLYNSIRDVDGAKEIIAHSYREHVEAETLLRSIQVTDALNVNWVAGAKKLKDALQHHIDEEEGRIFESAKQLFTQEEATAMADVFLKMKPLIKQQTILGSSWDLLVNMMPARLRRPLSKFAPQPLHT